MRTGELREGEEIKKGDNKMRSKETLISEIPSVESGIEFYINSIKKEIDRFPKDLKYNANDPKHVLHRRRKYLLRKAIEKLNIIREGQCLLS